MTDEDVAKLVSRLVGSLATKDDIKRLEGKIDNLDDKTDTILEFAEAVDETTADHEKRLKQIEATPIIAQQING